MSALVARVLADLGMSVVSNPRDNPDESEEHVFDTWELEWEDTLLRNVAESTRAAADAAIERGDDLRWERDMLMADARHAATLWGPDCATVERLIGEARAVNHDLVFALRCKGAL